MLSSLEYTKNKRQSSGFVLENSAEYAEYVLKEGNRLLQKFQAQSTNLSHQRPPESSRTWNHGHTASPAALNQRTPCGMDGGPSAPRISTDSKTSTHTLGLPNHGVSPHASHDAKEHNSMLDPHMPEDSSTKPASRSSNRYAHKAEFRPPKGARVPSTDCNDCRSSPSAPDFSTQGSGSADLRRRSGRAINKPSTYNVRVLCGLERLEKEEAEENPPAPSVSKKTSSHIRSLPSPVAAPKSSSKKEPCRRTQNMFQRLWNRELHGHGSSSAIYTAATSDFRLWKSWKGASNDVVALAWSPDATRFAAGATAQSDEYNRKNNLLYGDLVQSTLHELPDHFTHHPSPRSVTDERMYTSVTDMQWVGDKLYTASYDKTVKVWDAAPSRHPSCLQTLRHQSQVVVMDLSRPMPNLIATGTDGFHLWDLTQGQDALGVDLEITRSPRQKAVNLVPTTLAWGHTAATSNFLVGGMAERIHDEYKVPHLGHMCLWAIGQSSIVPLKVSPHSQNVFDIKWHPSEPRYAAATTYSQAMQLPLKTRTVVQIYGYSDGAFTTNRSNRFPCPAADINVTSFCPINSFYVTASCTDGRTYVWDVRNNEKAVHRLTHDLPIQPLHDDYPREFTDYGVTVALWGTAIEQFYTGGSDGSLKQWDIRRSPEDALVANIANFQEGITSAAFSEDKTQLLIGSHGGGIRLLSAGPCSDPENNGFTFHSAPEPHSQEPSGQEASRALISSAEIETHPIYGPGQGPKYKGPYARWARGLDQDAPLEQTRHVPLKEEYRIRQLCAPRETIHYEVDPQILQEVQMQRHIAQARNGQPRQIVHPHGLPVDNQPTSTNEGDAIHHSINPSQLFTERRKSRVGENGPMKGQQQKQSHDPVITNLEFIDLTGDSQEQDSTPTDTSWQIQTKIWSSPSPSASPLTILEEDQKQDQDPEDDYWWPDSGCYEANICDSD